MLQPLPRTRTQPILAEIKRGLSLLFQPGDVVEVRILKTKQGTVSGYFDDFDAMAQAIFEADRQYLPFGIYHTINKLDPALLARACNRLRERSEVTTADANVKRRRWLPIDCDPVRPAGVSSSDAEHGAAIARAKLIAQEMPADWGQPILADSGNGAHLLYRTDMPNDPESLRLVGLALADLDRRYSDDKVKVDVACGNAARIWKAYGTPVRKGDSIPARPHRVSRILEVPSNA
jgi:hypothetical protein